MAAGNAAKRIDVGDRQGVTEERFAVLPIAQLVAGGQQQRRQRQNGGPNHRKPQPGASGDFAQAPGGHDGKPYGRKVGITVRDGLRANANKPDHRD